MRAVHRQETGNTAAMANNNNRRSGTRSSQRRVTTAGASLLLTLLLLEHVDCFLVQPPPTRSSHHARINSLGSRGGHGVGGERASIAGRGAVRPRRGVYAARNQAQGAGQEEEVGVPGTLKDVIVETIEDLGGGKVKEVRVHTTVPRSNREPVRVRVQHTNSIRLC